VAGIAGTAVALAEAQAFREAYTRTCRSLARRLIEGITKSIPGATLNGHPDQRLPNNVHFSFEGAESDTMLAELDRLGIAASAGSACTSATWEPSHVLVAMGIPLNRAIAALRLTLGPENTPEEIDRVLSVLPGVVAESRAKARAGASAK
jgi:cysteine desulfurase